MAEDHPVPQGMVIRTESEPIQSRRYARQSRSASWPSVPHRTGHYASPKGAMIFDHRHNADDRLATDAGEVSCRGAQPYYRPRVVAAWAWKTPRSARAWRVAGHRCLVEQQQPRHVDADEHKDHEQDRFHAHWQNRHAGIRDNAG